MPDGRTEAQQEQESPSSQTPQASEERSAGARGAADAPRARGARRGGLKRAKAIVDDIDTLQIRGRVRGGVPGVCVLLGGRAAWLGES